MRQRRGLGCWRYAAVVVVVAVCVECELVVLGKVTRTCATGGDSLVLAACGRAVHVWRLRARSAAAPMGDGVRARPAAAEPPTDSATRDGAGSSSAATGPSGHGRHGTKAADAASVCVCVFRSHAAPVVCVACDDVSGLAAREPATGGALAATAVSADYAGVVLVWDAIEGRKLWELAGGRLGACVLRLCVCVCMCVCVCARARARA